MVTTQPCVPGVNEKDIDIQIENGTLTLKGERKNDANEKERYYRRERPMGTFMRTVTLPATVKADSAKAEYRRPLP